MSVDGGVQGEGRKGCMVTGGEGRGDEGTDTTKTPSEIRCYGLPRPLLRLQEVVNLSSSNADSRRCRLFAGAVPCCPDSPHNNFTSFSPQAKRRGGANKDKTLHPSLAHSHYIYIFIGRPASGLPRAPPSSPPSIPCSLLLPPATSLF